VAGRGRAPMDQRRFTAYCGLYCRDCIPGNGDLFRAARELTRLLNEVGFDEYASRKAEKVGPLRDYAAFAGVLDAITQLECPAPCREGGGNPDCAVRACAIEKHYVGCWECEDFRGCSLLDSLRRFHGENIDHNLEMIRQHGPDNWAEHRAKHYPWSNTHN